MFADFSKAEEKARQVLEENLINSPPTPIIQIAENYGYKVRKVNLGKYSSTIAGYTDLNESTIFVNEEDSENRQAFTIAHELGHQLLHKGQFSKEKYSILFRRPLGKTDPDLKEQEANAFAAEVLVPMNTLNKYLNEGVNEPAILASIFGVSQEVINYRLKDGEKRRKREN